MIVTAAAWDFPPAERPGPPARDEVGLRVDGEQLVNADRLRDALLAPLLERWSGVVFDQPDELEFWLSTATAMLVLLVARDGPIERGLVAPSVVRGVPTIVSAGSSAYRTKRPIDGTNEFELGLYAHGSEAEALAEKYVELLRTWERDHRRGPQARIEVYAGTTPDRDLPQGRVVDKRRTRVVVSWN